MTKKELKLEGLDCANCALKIERHVQKLEGVSLAHLDFASGKLKLEYADEVKEPQLLDDIKALVHKLEPDVRVLHNEPPQQLNREEHETEHDNPDFDLKTEWMKLGLGAVLFVLPLLFEFGSDIESTLYMLSYVVVGSEVVMKALRGVMHGQVFSENFLMSVATIGAFFIGQQPEGVAVMLFYLVGELFQNMALDHSRKSIADLMDIRPDSATLKVDQTWVKTDPKAIRIGQTILVKAGERVPLDGIVLEGNAYLDTSALTGESNPRFYEKGKAVLSGSINLDGSLILKVSKTYSESTVSKILDLVENASAKKAKTEQFISKFAEVYTPIVVFSALALGILPPLILKDPFNVWIYRALIFLVISCPCALVISIPLGFFGGIGGASKRGILIKGGQYLEALNEVDTIVFDKTGTLTKGSFDVVEIQADHPAQLLRMAAHAESHSNHPIAQSILKAYGQPIDDTCVKDVKEVAGQGIQAVVDGADVLVGNAAWMTKQGVSVPVASAKNALVHVAQNRRYVGSLVIADTLKTDAAQTMAELRKLGIRKTVLLTGDQKEIGEMIGQTLGMDEIHSELLPADKVRILEQSMLAQTKSSKTIFVGDGINDAPVLARADIGIAMGGLGSDAAIEAADIVLMTDEPHKMVTALKIARHTRHIVYQNIALAIGVKLFVLSLGALGMATMWEAVFADVGVALLAVINATRVTQTRQF